MQTRTTGRWTRSRWPIFSGGRCRWSGKVLRDRETGRPVRAVLPVHLLGHPVDMQPIVELARKFDLPVIEDATEGLGAHYRERAVGSLGDIACFSFNGNKLITTGGGGMIATDREEWADKAKYLTTQAKDDPLEYMHHEIGYNYRLTNVLAAIGVAQMEKLEEYVAAKRRRGRLRREVSAGAGDNAHAGGDWAKSTFWMYTVLVDAAAFGMDSRELLAAAGRRAN